jgi:hypothetical protein
VPTKGVDAGKEDGGRLCQAVVLQPAVVAEVWIALLADCAEKERRHSTGAVPIKGGGAGKEDRSHMLPKDEMTRKSTNTCGRYERQRITNTSRTGKKSRPSAVP